MIFGIFFFFFFAEVCPMSVDFNWAYSMWYLHDFFFSYFVTCLLLTKQIKKMSRALGSTSAHGIL